MKTNDRGIAVPGIVDPLPWKLDVKSGAQWAKDARGVYLGLERDTMEFQIVAANFHERMADIVRRLADVTLYADASPDVIRLQDDADSAWSEYQEEVQGGE